MKKVCVLESLKNRSLVVCLSALQMVGTLKPGFGTWEDVEDSA